MISIEYIDLKVSDDQLLILVSMFNATRLVEVSSDDMPTSKMATLATGKLAVTMVVLKYSLSVVVLSADTPSPRLQNIIIINSEVTYEVW